MSPDYMHKLREGCAFTIFNGLRKVGLFLGNRKIIN